MMNQFHATTIFAIHHNGKCSMAGDGQVTFGNSVVMKHTAKKVRKIFNGKVLAGFAGSVADAFTLFEMFEGKLEEYNGNLQRAAVELAKEWRSDKVLRRLEAMLIVMNQEDLLLSFRYWRSDRTRRWNFSNWLRWELCFSGWSCVKKICR